nr:MAG TPA: hypothetical protein [Caudoviricetes sp.]
MENIAKIRLAPGKAGFYDPISNIHLTLGSPEVYVQSGTNCAALRRNLHAGLIELVEGTLGGDIPPVKIEKMKDGSFRIVSNAEEVNKPIYKDSTPSRDIKIDDREKNGPGKDIEKELPMKTTSEEELSGATVESEEEQTEKPKKKKVSK